MRWSILALAACASAGPVAPWRVPTGWKSEAIPFPLDFAPSVAHRGVEELRWVIVLARDGSAARPALDALAAEARCDQSALRR